MWMKGCGQMGKTIVITGMTSGIGKALTLHLTAQGHHVIGIARNQARLNTVKTLTETHSGKLTTVCADFKSLHSVKQACDYINRDFDQGIDVLIHNAAIVPRRKLFSEDTVEMQYQVNHLVPIYMTHELYDLLVLKQGMMIITSSNAHKQARFSPLDLEAIKRYHPMRSYTRTKLYNLMFALAFDDHLRSTHNMRAFAVHPGLVKTEIGTKDTTFFYRLVWKLFTSRGIKEADAIWTYDALINHPKDYDQVYYYKKHAESYLSIANDKNAQKTLLDDAVRRLNIPSIGKYKW